MANNNPYSTEQLLTIAFSNDFTTKALLETLDNKLTDHNNGIYIISKDEIETTKRKIEIVKQFAEAREYYNMYHPDFK